MPYRITTVDTTIADDSNLSQVLYKRKAAFYQSRDLEHCEKFLRVGPSDSETEVTLAPVTTGYFLEIRSDYPVKVRLNGAMATQFTLVSNNTAQVNLGAPLPDQCVFLATCNVTSLYVEPIASAAQTANVKVCVTGDPANVYT